ncbi:LutB/LldF family L-lactate oxidation iron-sulfur protein [Micrococcus sp. FDAARGOS_333]|uniref:LutB/LldF family L-lactate oxidation iron-sulfur protein n=1 Tax=Micrococcus sp. FDAARGOS_333 TaxID=1930558 RepID=UPI000B4DFCB3|nr:LutB/LldF family L-lactate oxidation iron-sulfur protein [Micrococcus sp. FDAARGOS_333]PNL18714.1 iron-sulfur cluster-binding protein [Micrococcus sp. FDAARGOS_333]
MSRTDLGMPTVRPAYGHGHITLDEPFPDSARTQLGNTQMRKNIRHATHSIRAKRARVVDELPDWQRLRAAGSALKQQVMADLPALLEQLEANVTARGGVVHWARDAEEANRIVTELVKAKGVDEVIKVKSMATQEIGLEEALNAEGIAATETDLAELIVQLGHDKPSHILVPAIHKNRNEIRDIFVREMEETDESLTSEPKDLAEAARRHLRERFLRSSVAISGANFGVAETGTLSVVESEGNGRMCLTLPETLITVMGIEKLVPTFQDLEVFLQLLPRSSTGERMNPYTSMWTGVTPGDGPQEFHLVLLDNGRSAVLSDPAGRSALHCIRCSACMNVCPVYEQTGGHAYGSVYPGPIGAILSPQLTGVEDGANGTLPYASSLCGACYDVCPVAIDIPSILVHLRDQDVQATHARKKAEKKVPVPSQMDLMMKGASTVMSSGSLMGLAERGLPVGRLLAGKDAKLGWLPGIAGGWTDQRDVPAPPQESFRHWWKRNRGGSGQQDAEQTTTSEEEQA